MTPLACARPPAGVFDGVKGAAEICCERILLSSSISFDAAAASVYVFDGVVLFSATSGRSCCYSYVSAGDDASAAASFSGAESDSALSLLSASFDYSGSLLPLFGASASPASFGYSTEAG